MTHEIKLTNPGPIAGTFSIPLDGPGLYELAGSKGTGKSTVLSAIDMIAGHKTTITVHDGERSGSVEGFGVVVPIGGRKRRRGDLELDTIDSEAFDLTDLIDPPAKTPETRDAQRIKALASLTDLELKPEDFYAIVGGQKAYEALGVKETDDPVTLCSRIKAAIETEARKAETVRDTEAGHAAGQAEQFKNIDLDAPSDSSALADAAEAKAAELSQLKSARAHGLALKELALTASRRLKEAKEAYQGPSTEEARDAEIHASAEADEVSETVERLRASLHAAEESLKEKVDAVASAVKTREHAEQHEATLEKWQQTINEADLIDLIEEEDIEFASSALEKARKDQEAGLRVRDAKQAKIRHDAHVKAGEEAAIKADSLRSTARSVFDVLASKLKLNKIKLESEDGDIRLVVDHPVRGKTLYDKDNGLSDGERVLAAIEELLPLIAEPGLLALPQRIYQDLPPSDHKKLAEYATEHKLFLFGAKVSDGPLVVEKV